MNIPYSLPHIDKSVVDELVHTLTVTGWLTSGPKVKSLEEELVKYTTSSHVICVNSWVSGAMLMLKWLGVGAGDEVIIPAYTYSATALCIMNIGAKPVMVDVGTDFNIDVSKIKKAITIRTKAIIPVDLGGYPCDFDAIFNLLKTVEVQKKFRHGSYRQEKLGRIFVLGDAAHSIGAIYKNKKASCFPDVAIFSFHSVKNITTGEGGAICLNLPSPFNNEEEYKFLKAFGLNGQTKSAFEKNQIGGWRYDIIDQGLKINMPDVCAAIGLAQLRQYKDKLLPERERIFNQYSSAFSKLEWAEIPPAYNSNKCSSYHLYLLRIVGIIEEQRDLLIQYISSKGVGVNVHYIPMPMLTLFKNKGYKIENYPVTYDNYSREISLPLYNNLSQDQVDYTIEIVKEAYKKIILQIE